MTPPRGRAPVAPVVAAVLALGLAVAGCSADRSAQAIGGEAGPAAAPGTPAGPGTPGASGTPGAPAASGAAAAPGTGLPVRVGEVNKVARAAVRSVPVYRSPRDVKAWTTLSNPLPSKAPLVFLVQVERGDWLRVLLPVRPNQSQGWVRARDVRLFQHDYRIVVSLGAHTLTVFKRKQVVMKEKVGLGTATTPTPGGTFYLKELLKPPAPGGPYGPFAYGLSGYSPVLDEFLGGDGQLGIHGTDEPAGIGKDVSHGCIRMSNAAITKLAGMLPLGVPVQIVR